MYERISVPDYVPESLRHMFQSQSKYLSCCAFEDYAFFVDLVEDFAGHLTAVELTDQNWSEIPEVLFNLPRLQNLTIYDSHITQISGKIKELQHLSNLTLVRSEIETLPDEIMHLTGLRRRKRVGKMVIT